MPSLMVPIELDDGPSDLPGSGSVLRTRRARAWLAVGAAGLVLVLVGAQWAVDAWQRSAWNRLADRTNVLAPLGRSLGTRWTPDTRLLVALDQGAAWRGSVVTQLALPDGSLALVAVDGTDGHHRWTTALTGPDDQRRAQSGYPVRSGSCEVVPGTGPVVACEVNDAVGHRESDGSVTFPPGSASRLVMVDPRDGHLRADHRLATGTSGPLVTVLRGDLAVLGPTMTAAGAEVVGVDLASGAERWRRTLQAVVVDHGAYRATRAGDGIAVVLGGTLTVLGPDGAVRRTVAVVAGTALLPLSDGRISVATASGTLVVGAEHDVALEGRPVWAAVDDGSLPGFVFTQQDTLRAYGPDGSLRWRAPATSTDGIVVLNGMVYLPRSAGAMAVDGTTGRERWHDDVTMADAPIATDGRVLLVQRSTDVVALDPATGAALWSSSLPAGHPVVGAFQGLLIGWSRDGDSSVVLG